MAEWWACGSCRAAPISVGVSTNDEADRLAAVRDTVDELATSGPLRDWALGVLGQEGTRWLDRLPQTVLDAYLSWGFVPDRIHPQALRSLVITGRSERHGGGLAVLKVEPHAAANMAALGALSISGVGPTLLASLPDNDAYLLDWLPGEPMSTENPEAALQQVVTVVRRLATISMSEAAVPSFTEKVAADVATTRRLLSTVHDSAHPFDDALLEHDLHMADWVQAQRPQVLVHGDLITKNTLLADGVLRLIDPSPCMGPVEFDIAHLCARISAAEHVGEYLDVARTAARRGVAGLPEVELDPAVLGWLVCHTARVYYAFKIAMRQDVSAAYLSLVTSRCF